MTDVTGPKSPPATPFDTSADVLSPGAPVGDIGPAGIETSPSPEAKAFAGGTPKFKPVSSDQPLKEAAMDLRQDGEALLAVGLEAAQAKAAEARVWADIKRAEAAERVRNGPMKAVGVAFGVGLFAGLLLRRR